MAATTLTKTLGCTALLAALASTAATDASARPAGQQTAVPVVQRPDLQKAFTDLGTQGTLVVTQRGAINRTVIVGSKRAALRIPPSSTFKIPNSLIAIDAGVASGPQQPYPGPNANYLLDGKPLLSPVCEGDLTLGTAFANSCIPIYQRIARQVGTHAYRHYLRELDYGNRRVTHRALEQFWLRGPLTISAVEQVSFLERLRQGTVPVSAKAIGDVREMMVTETAAAGTVRGKTGYVFAQDGAPRRGWWIGSIERPGQASTFALNLDMPRDEHLPARVSIGRALLGTLGAFAPSPAS